MSKITNSGICYDESGQTLLVTQGLSGYTLVAKKKILFRLFIDQTYLHCTTVVAKITYKVAGFFTIVKSIVIPLNSLIVETDSPNGPSVGVLFTGDVFPYPSGLIRYEVDFYVYGSPFSVSHFRIPEIQFLMPGRLRLLIHDLVGTAPWGTTVEPTLDWLVDMFRSLERLAAMLPVRDGIKFGLSHLDAGLCFLFGDNIDTWPQPVPTQAQMIERLLAETNQINSGGTTERVDATVCWRPRDATKFPPLGGEDNGGKAISYNSPAGKGLALVVGGSRNGLEFTAPIMAQEIGHLFGLEPKESPHFEDPQDGLHSKDPAHNDPFAFDFYLVKPYQPPSGRFVGDVMNNLGGGAWQGRDMVLYNVFDWEYLRQKFLRLPGISRSITDAKRPSKTDKKKLAAELETMFASDPVISAEGPVSALYSKRGFAWHWTSFGFRLSAVDNGKKSRSRLTPAVAMIRSMLGDIGISEAYAPIGDQPLSMVIAPNTYTSFDRKEISDFCGVSDAKTPRR